MKRMAFLLVILLSGYRGIYAQDSTPMAPSFSLPTTAGKAITLSTYRNRWLVLVFFPKAHAQKDIQQMQSLKEFWPEISARGAQILGVSMDSVPVLRRFKESLGLPFELASDEEKRASESYGALGIGGLYSARKTFIIAPNGRIVRTLDRVREKEHGRQVLQALEAAQAAYSPN